ncbi:DevR family CRISPR-associated autoregulator [Bacteroidetes/Chlorobi group bacterium Naka2016]|jgi:CRISPR-associated protein Cst2|nr:MAG: DevR family CRISPR-associated autoregulator [Bacteroidetes/Chlorobi group bacterium Naka2016]
MIRFISFAVKLQLNVHDLNNETGAGNVTDIRIMEFLDNQGERVEAPAVSGRMLKHWHLEGMRNLILNGNYSSVPLCAGCKVGEPIRPAEIRNNNLVQVSKSETVAINECCICDIHGYLIAQGAEGERGTSARRSSRAMFSWLMPVLGIDTAQKQVLHTRVSQQQEMAEGESAAQMIFNKSYASGIYAFVSALDVERIGLVELNLGTDNPYAVDDNARKDRIKVAIESYRLMISGQIGASLSHAIPHQNPIEILVAYSETGPLPFPVSPMYSDYLSKTVGLMPRGTQFLYWGENSSYSGIKKVNIIDEIFQELLRKVENGSPIV